MIRDSAVCHVGLDLFVRAYVCKTENQLFRTIVYLRSYTFDLFNQSIHGYVVCEYQRIEPPYYGFFTQYIGKSPECFNTFCQRRDTGFQSVFLIIIQSELDIAADTSFFQDRQIRKKRFGIFRPEHYESCIPVRDIALFSVERVVPHGIAGFEPMEEPVRIECRDVRAAACRYDVGGRDFHLSAVYDDICFFPSHIVKII